MKSRNAKLWTLALLMCCFVVPAAGAPATTSAKDAAAKSSTTAKSTAKTNAAPTAEKAAGAATTAASGTGNAATDAMMAEMMKLATPGTSHEWLKKSEGNWKATVKSWMGPGEPMVNEGVSENHMILGGRFLEQRYKGTFMNQPFEGYGLCGYDNQKKAFTSIWIDNSSTATMTTTGSMDESGKMVTMTGEMMGMDGKPAVGKTVTTLVDDNTVVFSVYGTMQGKEMLMMEITYKRMM